MIESPAFGSTIAFSKLISVQDRDTTRFSLSTIGQAAKYLTQSTAKTDQGNVDWQHAFKTLESAARDPRLVDTAALAMRIYLRSAGMLRE